MADFDSTRRQLRDTRGLRDEAGQALAAAQEELKRTNAARAELDRVFDADNEKHRSEHGRLEQTRILAEEKIRVQRGLRDEAVAAEAVLVGEFGLFSDPRTAIERLKDSFPILLMPVRLETRFKTAVNPRTGAAVPQLWVRIYPDDCSIDSFDETLTETELANGKSYWTSFWQAGGVEEQERSAWRVLASRHGSGRAAWIARQLQPVNLAAKPSKPRPQDVILTIPTEVAPSTAEGASTATFWRSMWLADGDAAKTAAALAAFENDVGQARAAELAAQYVPANFDSALAPGVTRQDVNLSLAFVVFPALETKQNAWSHAPKAVSLPDRFVFLGYETEDDSSPVFAIGAHVPSPLITGPDPGAPQAEQIQHDAAGEVVMPEELKWISDFDRAVRVGMGLRIDLTPTQAASGFKRVLVVGLRLNADEQAAKGELETLFRHHSFSRAGLALVPQGTPTNNTEALSSGAGRLDAPDESFDDLKGPLFTPESGWLDKKDGQWLAEYLGIDPALFLNTHHAGAADQITARAMNVALWPATLGYWMEAMMADVFTREGVEQTREFFNRFVVAGGACPAVRIGSQPYGILPATTFSRMAWLQERAPGDERISLATVHVDPRRAYLARLYPVLLAIDQDFREMSSAIPFVGKSGDPHDLLLDIVGLHPGSVEWSQRYAESLQTFFNRLNLFGYGGFIQRLITSLKRMAANDRLVALGHSGKKAPPILDLIFNGKHNQLKGGVVDDVPLSETIPVRPYTADNRNYIQYLIDAANTSFNALYSQTGFKDDKAPTALLYLFLRHALQLGYHDVSIRLHEDAGLYSAAAALKARVDDPILHVRQNQTLSESRYQPLYALAPQITGGSNLAVHEFITSGLSALTFARYLREQLDAMERLKQSPTAQLERAFADHVDCCTYRLDAWLLGLVNYQLSVMRGLRDSVSTPARQGIYLGAYAWLEELRPENKVLTPVTLTDPDLAARFTAPGEPPLMRDSTNEGYIHAPSLNHAVAAAVLRNGFISNASPANRQTMAVNLTSERVRTALAMIEGIRAGQSLADLLGYQFERGLHDRHNLAEVDKYIYKLRRAFPIRADRFNSTKPPEGVPIEAIEARNVVNGLSLVEHIKAVKNKIYPFGLTTLPATDTQADADAINAEVDRLLESHDAVADLALSEGVYQAVLGNYDRVASTYDAYARGDFPPEPDVIRTPLNGVGLTHRFALHLAAGADPNTSPVAGVSMTPRAQGEPAVNLWLADTLPPLDKVGCLVDLREAATGADVTREVTLDRLGLQPADLYLLISEDNQQAMTELDDRVARHAVATFGPRPDAPLKIRYMETDAAEFSFFDLMPLTRNLRRLITKSRPLQSGDLTMMNEAESRQEGDSSFDKTRLDLVRARMQTLRTDFANFKATVDAQLSDTTLNRPNILADADSHVTSIADLLARAAAFAIPQSGWGFAYDFRRRTFTAILKRAAALVDNWDAKLKQFIDKLAEAGATSSVDEKYNRLAEAERAISTSVTNPRPATPLDYVTLLTTEKQPDFVVKRDQFDDVRNTTLTSVSQLLAHVESLLPLSAFDFAEFDFTPEGDEMVRFAEDVSGVCAVILKDLDRRLAASNDLFVQHAGATAPAARVKILDAAARVLLGADFSIVPEFKLTTAQGDEVANALAAGQSGDLFQHLDPADIPLDTWLYGVARVREKVHAWEQTVMFAGALSVAEPELEAMQLPFIPGDLWLGLEFPATQKLDKDRLLYTAHFATAFNKAANQCGLLLDEWTETLPDSTVDTGVAFHYDRPNCEAPQAMLLVTPSQFRGAWQWDDLVGTLHETLDLAKRRAVEPKHIDNSPYAPFLPATVIATQVSQLTIALELGLNNKIAVVK
jgi:hypothetical protein